ncbi:DUF2520 domain-containing protein [Nocardioidaceae bacterium]|nr:DUF2520 domain-containing protein [Nocardioidaceae bacterium]
MRHAGGQLRLGVVGAGRVGAVLAAAWRQAGAEVVAVSGESDASRHRAATLLPGVPVVKPSAVARACDVLVLAVPDDMLGNVARQLAGAGALTREPGEAQPTVVHLSGRHGLGVLDPAAEVGAARLALHPAMTFTGTVRDLSRLPRCAYAMTSDGPETAALGTRLVSAVDGSVVEVVEEHRALYHAALAHGANHLVTLVAQAREMLAAAGADDPSATLRPLLEAALGNALEVGDSALTGPIVRGDVETVRAHVLDLLAHQPLAVPSYVALARDTASRATLDGRLVPVRAAAVERVLALAEDGRTDLLRLGAALKSAEQGS